MWCSIDKNTTHHVLIWNIILLYQKLLSYALRQVNINMLKLCHGMVKFLDITCIETLKYIILRQP